MSTKKPSSNVHLLDKPPAPRIVHCSDCRFWDRFDPASAFGQCQISQRHGLASPAITTDMTTCSKAIGRA